MKFERDLVVAALPAYEVEGELGRGGWGIVLAGRHRQLGRKVAIKQLPRAFAADPAVRARFVAEARVLASLDHPHIVPVYDYVELDGLCLLVMELLPGGTVWSRFTGEGLTMDAACAVALAACDALHCAHTNGVLHRDIKPENLIFTAGRMLKVTDFGIAKVISGSRTLATRAGEVLGTPAYMAPEQAQAAELTPATDVYATGTMLYELLSGRLPFAEDGDALALLYRHVHEKPPPLAQVAPKVPLDIAAVVMKAIATNPGDRFVSAADFGLALAEAATTAWGPGWLGRSDLPVMAASPIVAATERRSGPAAIAGATSPSAAALGSPAAAAPPTEAVSRPRPAPAPPTQASSAAPPTAPAAPPTAPAEPAAPPTAPAAPAEPAAPAQASSPVPTGRVRPTSTIRRRAPADLDDEALELVPVSEVLRPPPPTASLLVGLALLLLALAVAFAGGSPDRVPFGGSVRLNGVEVGSGERVELDLAEPVEVTGGSGAAPATVELRFSALGIRLGSASAPVQVGQDDSFTASVDATGARYLVAGEVTGEIELQDGSGAPLSSGSFPVASRQAPLLTVPGAVGLALLLFVVAYAESLLRSRRRGRKALTATVGMGVVGGLGGVAAVILAWLLTRREPVASTLAACAVLGAGAGLAAAMAATRIGKRKRMRPKKAS